MHRSTRIPLLCLCACSIWLIQCGGSDQQQSAGVNAGGSSSSLSTVGGSGNGPNNATGSTSQVQPGEVALLTGTNESSGFNDGPGGPGLLINPNDVVSDGTHLYVLEGYTGNLLRSLDMATGAMHILAGSGNDYCQDGVGKAAAFNIPTGLTMDLTHQNLYVADACGIRKVVIATGEVSTFAPSILREGQGMGDGSLLANPVDLAMDSSDTHLYVADILAHQIRVFDMNTQQMTTLAGSGTAGSADGVGSAATLCGPQNLALDATDTKLYFADICDNDVIRVVDIPSQQVTTIAGSANHLNFDDGVGAAAGFSSLQSLAVDSAGTHLYTSEGSGPRHLVREMDIASRVVTTIAGSQLESGNTNGSGTDARFAYPVGLTVVENNLYVADSGNLEIRKIALGTHEVTTYAGATKSATLHDPVNAVTDGTYLYVVDKDNNAIRRVATNSGYTTTLAGNGSFGALDGNGKAATFEFPSGIAIAGSRLYVADTGNQLIRTIDLTTQQVTTLAGTSGVKGATDGVGTSATFNAPQGLVADPNGQNLYVTDQFNHQIRKIALATGQVTTFAGATEAGFTDGTGTTARFNMPANITVTPDGKALYVTDASNNAVRKIAVATAQVSTVAGSPTAGNTDGAGTNARFDTPWGIVTDGSNLYLADAANGNIRRIDLATSMVSLQCGRRLFEYEDGTCGKALFQVPAGLALDANGTWLYVCESGANQIRQVRLK